MDDGAHPNGTLRRVTSETTADPITEPDARASAAHTGRPRLQVRDQPSPDVPYPRRIEHAEVVEYGYDPGSDTYSYDVNEASRP